MGERLNVEIIKGGKVQAAVWFHWSAYTMDSFLEIDKVINLIEGRPYKTYTMNRKDPEQPVLKEKMVQTSGIDDKNWKLRLIRGLELCGGGIVEEDLPLAKKLDNGKDFAEPNRSYGMVALSEKRIKEYERYEESRATIDLDNRTICNDTFYVAGNDYEDFVKQCKDACIDPKFVPAEKDVPVAPVDPDNMSFADLPKIIDFFGNLYESQKYYFMMPEVQHEDKIFGTFA